MKTYQENDGVIYADPEGRQIDTFVIFDTDGKTGLTHINHKNLKVPAEKLRAHPNAIPGCHLPFADACSFELFRKLRDKERNAGKVTHLTTGQLAKAS